ncbi:hypothetical protein LCGC14_0641590 [marine sediment metagenome]|uniref:Transposase IS30-like HTH domain-containing protein n=1 Tax=marine sediment metagenome TaxID=412755 RepID=A0A0F9R481_9ZZZZ|nr:hypothetical protein [archaeon]
MKRKKGANKKGTKRINETERQRILNMRKQGFTLRQIAGAFDLTNPAVFYILKKAETKK